jgi:hypothetical protein
MFLAATPTEDCSSAKASSACNLDAFEKTADKKPSAWGAFYCDLAPAISAGSRQAKATHVTLCPQMVLTRKVAAPLSPASHAYRMKHGVLGAIQPSEWSLITLRG